MIAADGRKYVCREGGAAFAIIVLGAGTSGSGIDSSDRGDYLLPGRASKSECFLESMKKWCVDRAKLQKDLTGAEEEAFCRYLEGISRDGQIEDRTLTTIVTMYWNVKAR